MRSLSGSPIARKRAATISSAAGVMARGGLRAFSILAFITKWLYVNGVLVNIDSYRTSGGNTGRAANVLSRTQPRELQNLHAGMRPDSPGAGDRSAQGKHRPLPRGR